MSVTDKNHAAPEGIDSPHLSIESAVHSIEDTDHGAPVRVSVAEVKRVLQIGALLRSILTDAEIEEILSNASTDECTYSNTY